MAEKTFERTPKDLIIGIAMTLCGGVLWGVNATVSKILMGAYHASPLWIACVREERIISLCADGMLDREIAEQLDISESTVRKHMQGILKKLNCKTARQAVALWVRSHAR